MLSKHKLSVPILTFERLDMWHDSWPASTMLEALARAAIDMQTAGANPPGDTVTEKLVNVAGALGWTKTPVTPMEKFTLEQRWRLLSAAALVANTEAEWTRVAAQVRAEFFKNPDQFTAFALAANLERAQPFDPTALMWEPLRRDYFHTTDDFVEQFSPTIKDAMLSGEHLISQGLKNSALDYLLGTLLRAIYQNLASDGIARLYEDMQSYDPFGLIWTEVAAAAARFSLALEVQLNVSAEIDKIANLSLLEDFVLQKNDIIGMLNKAEPMELRALSLKWLPKLFTYYLNPDISSEYQTHVLDILTQFAAREPGGIRADYLMMALKFMGSGPKKLAAQTTFNLVYRKNPRKIGLAFYVATLTGNLETHELINAYWRLKQSITTPWDGFETGFPKSREIQAQMLLQITKQLVNRLPSQFDSNIPVEAKYLPIINVIINFTCHAPTTAHKYKDVLDRLNIPSNQWDLAVQFGSPILPRNLAGLLTALIRIPRERFDSEVLPALHSSNSLITRELERLLQLEFHAPRALLEAASGAPHDAQQIISEDIKDFEKQLDVLTDKLLEAKANGHAIPVIEGLLKHSGTSAHLKAKMTPLKGVVMECSLATLATFANITGKPSFN